MTKDIPKNWYFNKMMKKLKTQIEKTKNQKKFWYSISVLQIKPRNRRLLFQKQVKFRSDLRIKIMS